MTAQEHESPRSGQFWVQSHIHGGYFVDQLRVSTDGWLPVDPFTRDIEVPAGSVLLDHVLRTAVDGGILYLTRHGRRVAGIVPADVAETFEEAEPDMDPLLGLLEVVNDHEARCGAPPADVAAEVDAQWAAAAAGR